MHRSFFFALATAFALTAVQCSAPAAAPDEPSKGASTKSTTTPVASPAPAARHQADAAVRVPIDGLPVFGRPTALVTVVAFTDYECPYCARAEKSLATLRAELGDDLRIAIGSMPLPIHDHAPSAARAFLAADALGKGEAMHARLFADRGQLDDAGLTESARALGLDRAAFEAAARSPEVDSKLRLAGATATSLGVTSTPTFFVNGRRVVGARPVEELRALVAEELAKARALVDKGVRPERVYATLMASAPSAAPVAEPELEEITLADVRVDDAPIRGASRAPITIVVFSDFECPYCVRLESTLRAVDGAYPGKVRVAFRNLPLPMHPHARLAAKAAVAADNQRRFWPYHDVLVQHRDALDREALRGYAGEVGLDLARFDHDLDDPATEKRVAADAARAAALGVSGTPVAFVNGRRVSGAQPLKTFKALIDRTLATAR
ncbi:MAG: thioredoxin domain-containing protein [Deltaproteobacteria bacterium]|nr:thioredoxin domain-containing protein [Deltaproteobacteria bacterium]